MDKEKLITIGIGLLVGIGAASLYFAATKVIPQIGKKNPVEIIQPKSLPSTPRPSVNSANKAQLSLNLPTGNSTVAEATSTVSGQTSPNATVVIFSNAYEKIATAGADGKFNDNVKLEEGLNVISITAFDGKNDPNTIIRNATLEISQ